MSKEKSKDKNDELKTVIVMAITSIQLFLTSTKGKVIPIINTKTSKDVIFLRA